jgi:hypothetical protein
VSGRHRRSAWFPQTTELAAAFDLLQHGVKGLDDVLQPMANAAELIDDVDDDKGTATTTSI